MKKITICILVFTFLLFNIYAQSNVPPPPPPYNPNDSDIVDDKIWTKVENEAQFPGGDKGWRDFLVTNLKVDSIANLIYMPDSVKSISHTVILKFIVSKDGSVKETKIEQASDSYCATEALRVMKLSPKWKPAFQNGRAVNAYRRQPFTFYFEQEK